MIVQVGLGREVRDLQTTIKGAQSQSIEMREPSSVLVATTAA